MAMTGNASDLLARIAHQVTAADADLTVASSGSNMMAPWYGKIEGGDHGRVHAPADSAESPDLAINLTIMLGLFMVIVAAFIGLTADRLVTAWVEQRRSQLGLA